LDARPDLRLVCCHQQKTSARTRFLRLQDSVLLFTPLPAGAILQPPGDRLRPAAGKAVQRAEDGLGLPAGSLQADDEFHAWAETPAGDAHVMLALVTTIDPPFEAAERLGGRFVAITELGDLPAVELAILRRAYERLIG
jgi:hypothetical protein